MIMDSVDPPRAHGQPLFHALLKRSPADFRVAEQLGIEGSGEGEHLLLQIEKTAMNTDEVVCLLQEWYAVGSADIGFCGMKDRHSISSQWVSVRTPLHASVFEQAAKQFSDAQAGQSSWVTGEGSSGQSMVGKTRPEVAGVCTSEQGENRLATSPAADDERNRIKMLCLLSATRHGRKLRRGAHAGNNFVITLREIGLHKSLHESMHKSVPAESQALPQEAPQEFAQIGGSSTLSALLERRLEIIAQQGFPNFIGSQRFGRGAQNLHRAQHWFGNSRKRVSRQQRSLYLSSGRSALFNLVCAARVRDRSWNQLRIGEPAILDGSHSFFVVEPETDGPSSVEERFRSFDIHPSGPWWGRGRSPAVDDCAAFEHQLLTPHETICSALERAGLSMERRALRARAQNLSHEWLDEHTLELQFSLSPGLYATTLLREFCTVEEPQR